MLFLERTYWCHNHVMLNTVWYPGLSGVLRNKLDLHILKVTAVLASYCTGSSRLYGVPNRCAHFKGQNLCASWILNKRKIAQFFPEMNCSVTQKADLKVKRDRGQNDTNTCEEAKNSSERRLHMGCKVEIQWCKDVLCAEGHTHSNVLHFHFSKGFTWCFIVFVCIFYCSTSTPITSFTHCVSTHPPNRLPSSFLPSPLFLLVDLVELLWEQLWRGCHAECGVQLLNGALSYTHALTHIYQGQESLPTIKMLCFCKY